MGELEQEMHWIEKVLSVELCPPERNVEVLTPSTHECDLIWRQSLQM